MNNEPTPYDLVGGQEKVKELVDRFYDHMDDLELAKPIRDLHARSLKASREKLYLFLTGWLGGPDLYVEKYGHPMLRRRHLPFSIGQSERDLWMHCMREAMRDMGIDESLSNHLEQAFWKTADHMRNQQEKNVGSSGLPIFHGKPPGSS